MRRAVWKYPVYLPGSMRDTRQIEISMPLGAEIVHVEMQNGSITMWAVVDPRQTLEIRTFMIVGTGHEFNNVHPSHLGTVLLDRGRLVLHVFETTVRGG